VLQSVAVNGYNFEAGDFIRDEVVTYDELSKAESLLTGKLNPSRVSIDLYHLDSITLLKFSTHELEKVFDCFH